MSFRHATMLLGVVLVVVAALAGGGPAGAARSPGHPGPRASALALLRHRGDLLWWAHRRSAGGAEVPAAKRVPTPGTSSALKSVFCVKAANCWAVGSYQSGGASLNEILHWNGQHWAKVATPNPGGTATGGFNELWGIRCVSAKDCWAVGDSQIDTNGELTEVLHWNGHKWAKAVTPNPGGTAKKHFNQLFDVTCTAAANCWAGGEYGNFTSGEVVFTMALHWNGSKWSKVSTPDPGGTLSGDVSALDGIRCAGAANCWAVGTYGSIITETFLNLVVHWNGHTWSKVPVPNPGGTGDADVNEFISVTCSSASRCWAAGTYGNLASPATFINEIFRWQGSKWSKVPVPNPDGTGGGAQNELFAVYCGSAANCWAVGSYGSISGGVGTILNEALHWGGSKWRLVATPNPAGTSDGDANELEGVRCTASANCWAVGDQQASNGPDLGVALRWNGSHWKAQ
jgi:hypothetical protein